MTDVIIRERRNDDIPALAPVLVAVHQRDGYPVEGVADPAAWLRLDRLIGALVAELNGQMVGHVAITQPDPADDAARMLHELDGTPLDHIAVVSRLFVDPAARGHQIGKRLMEAAMQLAQKNQRVAVLDVMVKDEAAIRTYERLGWVQIGEFSHMFNGNSEPAVAYHNQGPSQL